MFRMTLLGPADTSEIPGSTPSAPPRMWFATGDLPEYKVMTPQCPAGQVMTEFGCEGKQIVTDTPGGTYRTCPPGTTPTGTGCLVTSTTPPPQEQEVIVSQEGVPAQDTGAMACGVGTGKAWNPQTKQCESIVCPQGTALTNQGVCMPWMQTPLPPGPRTSWFGRLWHDTPEWSRPLIVGVGILGAFFGVKKLMGR